MADLPDWPNLAVMMFDRARAWAERPMLRSFRDGSWRELRWGAFARATASLARGLAAAGVAAGDRVVISAPNRAEYPIAEVALMALGAVPVPAYVTNTVADHAHVLTDCGARAAIVADARLAAALRQAGLPRPLVVMDDPPAGTIGFADLAADPAAPDDVADLAARHGPETLAALIYTSGTGGAPRGVMLPHRAILSNCRGAARLVAPLRLGPGDVYLSFLPLAHSYEHTVGQFFLPALGVEIAYARGVEHLAADLLTIRPTLLATVPRVLEAVRGRILGQIAHAAPWRQRLFRHALAAASTSPSPGRRAP